MDSIENYGWLQYCNKIQHHHTQNINEIGRIISVRGTKFIIISNSGELETELTGKLLYSLTNPEQPKVGDWVKFMQYDDTGYITEVLPRLNELYRKSPGKQTGKQVIATSIDKAVILQGLDNDFNMMRLERYIVQIIACHIAPVVILNKSDLIKEKNEYLHEIQKLQRDIPVFFCSTITNEGLDEIQSKVFTKGLTCVLIGSSGVGKSSLLNLIQDSVGQTTKTISASTGKGRHTTTRRDLFMLPNNCLIIDTPGMREFGIGFNEESQDDETFPIISEYAKGCKYADCNHINENGCAVKEAVHTGEINTIVYESYIKLIKEQQHFEKSVHEQKREGKRFGKMVREVKNHKKKYKY